MKNSVVIATVLTGLMGMLAMIKTHHPAGFLVGLICLVAACVFNEVLE